MSGSRRNRREFLTQLGLGCAHVGAVTLLNGITNMGLLNAAASANKSWVTTSANNGDYKALVCILLSGGNDSFNMIIPRNQDSYNDYAAVRTNLSIPQADLLPINPINPDGREYGLHPSMSNIQNLFETGKLSFLANVGALVRPTTLNDYNTGLNLPVGLYSHSDQRQHWQTSVPDDRSAVGWGGRLADLLQSNNTNQEFSMSLSLDGLNLFQRGNNILPYTASTKNNGAALLNGATNTNFYETLKRETIDDIFELTYSNALEQAYAGVITESKANSFEFDAAIAAGTPVTTVFDETDNFQKQLKMAARIMAARNVLNVSNQTFFIQLGGFDAHDNNLEEHASLLQRLDNGIQNFQLALEELGLENNVTTFSISDFGRKLVSNGDGSDHAWGGHAFVLGGQVAGKQIIGEFPELYLGNPLDTGGGRIIPTTSTDEFFAELAIWFGASDSDLSYILPNLPNFWVPGQGSAPLGFMV